MSRRFWFQHWIAAAATFVLVLSSSASAQSLPTLPPNLSPSALSQLAPLLAGLGTGGRLPGSVSSQEITALLAAPPGTLPTSLAALVPSLRSLGGESTLATSAHAVATALASGSTQGGSFSDVSAV